MVRWGKLFGAVRERDAPHFRDEMRRLLPAHTRDVPPSAYPPKEVTKVALRLKYQIEEVIPFEIDEAKVVAANSGIITAKVTQTAKEAGGKDYASCVVYALLVCKRWFKKQANLELWDADLHNVRATACEIIAKRIIETEEDQEYLMQDVLLKRYSVVRKDEETVPSNVIERAVDLHCLIVIGSSGYQKCIKYLWRGWIHQDDLDPSNFVYYKDRDNTSYWAHLNPDRMRVPVYQNYVQISISAIYLGLYTGAVNTVNEDGDLDVVEGILYLMTVGFMCDEFAKFWKVGIFYFGFWNAFNNCLYALLTASFVIRMIALGHSDNEKDDKRRELNALGYHIFCVAAPLFWGRLLLYLDTFRFFGAMLVVLKVMMRESLIFFALLVVVCVGFLQAFIGLNQVEGNASITSFIVTAMANAVMQSPEFDGFDDYAHPFGLILYYLFTFVVMVILLNILIALYNSAYEDITENAIDEYMAMFAQKTLQFVRAPDENVFIAPFNLIELFLLIIPFEWWMDDHRYERLNNYVMGVVYAPVLLVTAALEAVDARNVRSNRSRGEEDDDTIEEWEELAGDLNFESEGWDKKVQSTKPIVEVDADVVEIRQLKEQVEELTRLVRALSPEAEETGEKS
ncbi:Calcium channel yvc1 [Cladophialophora chaetospira]|uniref:Calcium channel yvc1 n=1 Tax=Cladophialophora chaetospira TaxID=386627 RepID=A0AA38X245_9EURO|nr:Calcium channel yvc1 [Cladophialophora chaetospira]